MDIEDLPIKREQKLLKEPKTTDGLDVAKLPVEELLDLRARVEAALPARSLKDLDLANELVLQVIALQAAQQKALNAEDTPTNQVAQAMNSLTSALSMLVKLQAETYTSERLKRIEAILIETLSTLPMEAQEAFLESYERSLEQVD